MNRQQRRAFDKRRKRGMKANFCRSVKYVPAWNKNNELPEAEQMHVMLKPLNMGDLLDLMDAIQVIQGIDPQDTNSLKKVNAEAFRKMMDSAGHLLPKYAEVHNLEDESGPVDTATLMSFPYYLELAAEILTQLASVSMPSEDDEKN